MLEQSLQFDFRLLNIFNLLQSIKQSVFAKCKSETKTPKQVMEEFEDMLLDNMKILCFKAFKKSSSVSQRYCNLMSEVKKLNKTVESNNSRMGKAVLNVWGTFEMKFRALIEKSKRLENIGMDINDSSKA